MKAIEILQLLNIVKSKPEAVRWIATGAVTINGVTVSLSDNIDTNKVSTISVGKSINLVKAGFNSLI